MLYPDLSFGRFGRTLLKPLYAKLYSNPFTEPLTDDETHISEWWASSIRATVPRVVEIKPPHPEVLIYTDAASGKVGSDSASLAAVVLIPDDFHASGCFSAVLSEHADSSWETIFSETTYIFGLELLAVVATVFFLRDFLRGKNVIFYVDNSNTKDALVRGYSNTPVINTLVQIFWAFAQSIGAWFWFEQVPSGRNIADLPTRGVELPLPSLAYSDFQILEILKTWATSPHKKEEFSRFIRNPAESERHDIPLSTGNTVW